MGKTQHFQKTKLKIFFKILLFKNWRNWECDALLLVFVNEIKLLILSYLWNCKRRCIFCIFVAFSCKSLETNIFWQLMIIILCLKRFSLRWIIKYLGGGVIHHLNGSRLMETFAPRNKRWWILLNNSINTLPLPPQYYFQCHPLNKSLWGLP